MSCDGILITGPNGHDFCIPIIVDTSWKKGPQPDPWRSVFDDLHNLVNIHEGIRNISHEGIRRAMLDSLQGAVRSLELPDGVHLGDGIFQGEKTFMAAS